MTRQEAINAMVEGKKVRHRYFSPDEWIEMDKASGKIFSEDGVCWGHLYDEGMEIRKGGFWEDDWELFDDGNILLNEEITNIVKPYENFILTDTKGNEYYIESKDLLEIVKEHNYVKEMKRKRTWIKPHKK